MPKVHANGIEIYYEVSGAGTPLVLIAGLNYGLWIWHTMIPYLEQHFQVIAFDNRGAGQTDKPAGPYSAAMLADDTIGLMDTLGIAQADILGHSMGGFVAQQMALAHPERISRLVLASTNFGGPNHIPVTQEALDVLMNREGDVIDIVTRGVTVATAPGWVEANPGALQELIAYRLSVPVPPDAYQAQLGVGLGLMSAEAAFEGRLSALAMPTVIFFGEHDRVVPVGNADLLGQAIPHAHVTILENTGHIWMYEAPERATMALVSSLAGL
jgi:pimeloyl-ACP methyl ester carboxylesterase